MRRYDLNNKTKDLEYHSGEYYSTIRSTRYYSSQILQ